MLRRPLELTLLVALVLCAMGCTNQLDQRHEALEGGRTLGACDFPSVGQIDTSCTATLIGPRWILTAAHCPTGARFVAGGSSAGITRCVRHPDFDSSGRVLDFMVCELDAAIDAPLVPILSPCEAAELDARADETLRALPVGRPVVVVGLGQPSVGSKRAGEMEVSSFIYSAPLIDFDDPSGLVGSRPGDSGGPTFLRMDDGTWRQVGVHHEGGVGSGVLDVFVPAALAWVETATALDVSPCHAGDTWAPTAACASLPMDLEGGGGTFPVCAIGTATPTPTCLPATSDAGLASDSGAGPDAADAADAAAPTTDAEVRDAGTSLDAPSVEVGVLEGTDAGTLAPPATGCACRAARPSIGASSWAHVPGLVGLALVVLGLARRRRRHSRELPGASATSVVSRRARCRSRATRRAGR